MRRKGNLCWVATVGIFITTVALAGTFGPTVPAQYLAAEHPTHRFSVGGGLGLGFSALSWSPLLWVGWKDTGFKEEKNGFVADLHMDYQVRPHIFAEFGGIWLPKYHYKVHDAYSSDPYRTERKIQQYTLVAALRADMPTVAKHTRFFAKVGAAAVYSKRTDYIAGVSDKYTLVEPVVALGIGQQVTPRLEVSVEVLSTIRNQATNIAGLVGVNYHFV